MTIYKHVEHGGEYLRLSGNYRIKLSGDDEWRPVVVYRPFSADPQPCAPEDEPYFVTDEARWADRFRELPPLMAEEWAEVRRGLGVDLSVLDSDDSDEDDAGDAAFRELLEVARDLAGKRSGLGLGGDREFWADRIDAIERKYWGGEE